MSEKKRILDKQKNFLHELPQSFFPECMRQETLAEIMCTLIAESPYCAKFNEGTRVMVEGDFIEVVFEGLGMPAITTAALMKGKPQLTALELRDAAKAVAVLIAVANGYRSIGKPNNFDPLGLPADIQLKMRDEIEENRKLLDDNYDLYYKQTAVRKAMCILADNKDIKTDD